MTSSCGLFGKRAIICLFGDSLTQLSFDENGWGAKLAHYYSRKADVINRGYGRYNTRWGLHVMNSLFPESDVDNNEDMATKDKYFMATIWFGANDAAMGQNCSINEEEFRSNLSTIVAHMKRYFHHIIVISPTPVDGVKRLQYQKDTYGSQATGVLERTLERAQQYRDIAADIAYTNNVQFLDLFTSMQAENCDNWSTLLTDDGLHLSPSGQDFVASQLILLLEQQGFGEASLPCDFFPWDQRTPGEDFIKVLDNFDEEVRASRHGQGFDMPYFHRQNSTPSDNSDIYGVSMTSSDALEAFFKHNPRVNIVGFGSLMSEISARTTFPNLTDFRIVRVEGYRRVFRHPAAIFFERGIANMDTLQMSSLSAEKNEGSSFVASVFTIEGETADNFLNREEEFDFHIVPYLSINSEKGCHHQQCGTGLMCVSGSDENYIARWGRRRYEEKYLSLGLRGIWNWAADSGLLPCSVYLRHCYLSAKKLSANPEIFESFMNDTYLCDRVTTVGEYLQSHPEVLNALPPDSLASRYNG